MAQSVKHSTLDFGSGRDLSPGRGIEPCIRTLWSPLRSLSLPLFLPSNSLHLDSHVHVCERRRKEGRKEERKGIHETFRTMHNSDHDPLF